MWAQHRRSRRPALRPVVVRGAPQRLAALGARAGLLSELAKHGRGAADLHATVNFFTKVATAGDAGAPSRSSPGTADADDWVTLRAELDVLVVMSTAPYPARPRAGVVASRGARRGVRRAAVRRGRPLGAIPAEERAGARPGSGGVRVNGPQPLVSSDLAPSDTVLDVVVEPGDGFVGTVPAGGHLRIVDINGNQAVDTLLYGAAVTGFLAAATGPGSDDDITDHGGWRAYLAGST